MCDRCRDMEKYFNERIREAVAMFPSDNESHIQAILKDDPQEDEANVRALFASQGPDFGLAIACAKAGLGFLLSNTNYDLPRTTALAANLIARLEVHRQRLLTMSNGSDGGIPITPPAKPDVPPGEKLH